jgi:hypothetical protein
MMRVDFGMSVEEFMLLHPPQLDSLVKWRARGIERQERHSDFMLAQIIAAQYNSGFIRFDEWRKPSEFLPVYASDREVRPKRRSEKAFTSQMERTMERAARYQQAQVARGVI